MKNDKNNRLLGTLLLIAGCVILVVSFILFMNYSAKTPQDLLMNDEIRTARAAAEREEAAKDLDLLQKRLPSVIAYYRKVDEGRTSFFEAMKAEADEGTVSDQAWNTVRGMRSISGTEEEVQHIYNIQNLTTLVKTSERNAEALEKAIGTGDNSGSFSMFLAKLSDAAWIVIMLFGALCIAAGLYLNHSHTTKHVLSQCLLYLLLFIGAFIMVFPFYWMISSSLKTRIEVNKFPPLFAPGNWLNFENYRIAFQQAPFARYFLNSVIVCVFSVMLVTFTTILGAFAFTRLKFPGRELIFSGLLSLMMLPFEMLVITNFSTIITLGLRDTLAALVAPFISSIFYTYIMRNFFMSIPDSLYWSARVDGCSNWRYLWKVMVPIARPSLVTVVLLNALASWNSFMWPLLVIKSTNNRTLPFGLYAFTTEAGSYQELIMAAATIVVLPMIILFLFCRKQILNGVARGGIKG